MSGMALEFLELDPRKKTSRLAFSIGKKILNLIQKFR